jgi:hypothetical protein
MEINKPHPPPRSRWLRWLGGATLTGLGIAFLVVSLGGSTHNAGAPTRILFVGNSYTAGEGGLADLVSRTATARGLAVSTDQITGGGFTLEQHYSNIIGSRDRIAEGGWDWVVMQEQSLRPIDDPALFFEYARLLDEDIQAVGARTMFFLTWAKEWAPQQQDMLNQAYCTIAAELDARVAPVGMAWALAQERDDLLELYADDGSHQSDLGQYLLGMVFHRRLWNDSPLGLPHDVSPHVVVSGAQATFLQQVAIDGSAECPRWIFDDGFESGTLNAWSQPEEDY